MLAAEKQVLSEPEVKKLLMNLLDEESIDVVYALMEKNATDEEISEETGLRLNTVRRALYHLYEYRIAKYNRSKDKEVGWFIYTWKLHLDKLHEIIVQEKYQRLEELRERLEFEQNNVFFVCPQDRIRVSFNQATDYNFTCPECESYLEGVDNQEVVERLENDIRRLQKELSNGSRAYS